MHPSHLSRIRPLAPALIRQIAAGEVVDRPASVVKELLENSVDAGATTITIDVEDGGARLIRVRDNGRGIHPDDLRLALARHSTSKLRTFDDLLSCTTLGFRGEALSSIAAVSRLTLTAGTDPEQPAWQVGSDGGRVSVPILVAPWQGTVVEVRDLFFNVPARRKFLRGERTELAHIMACVQDLAMVQPSIALRMWQGPKMLLDMPHAPDRTDQQQRLGVLLGREIAEGCVFFDDVMANFHDVMVDIALQGWLGMPRVARAQPDQQHFFVNGRPVRSRLLSQAVRLAYQDVLPQGRHTPVILFLTMPTALVDVNIHPRKLEVRFQDNHAVQTAVSQLIQRTIAGWYPGTVPAPAVYPLPQAAEAIPNTIPSTFPQSVSEPQAVYHTTDTRLGPEGVHAEAAVPVEIPVQQIPIQPVHPPAPETVPAQSTHPTALGQPLGRVLGQLHHRYIVAENAAGLVVVDMHAAHERILYEQWKAAVAAGTGIPSQGLNTPVVLTLTVEEHLLVEEHAVQCLQMGLDIAIWGPDTAVIRAMPAAIGQSVDVTAWVRDLLADLRMNGQSDRAEQTVLEALARTSCHHAVRAGQTLTVEEMTALLRQLERTDRGNQCNHGRPTWAQITIEALDRLLRRGR